MLRTDDPLLLAYRLRTRPAGDTAPTTECSAGVSPVVLGVGVIVTFIVGFAAGMPSPEERRAAEQRYHHLNALRWMVQDSRDPELIARAQAELDKADRVWGFR